MWRCLFFPTDFLRRKIAFFSGASEALYLRQLTTVGTSMPYYLHGYKRNPLRPGAIRKISLRRAVKDNSFSADRFLYATPPMAIFDAPIDLDLDLSNPLFTNFDWVFQQRFSSMYDASPSSPELYPCIVELYRCGQFNLRLVKSPLNYELAHAVTIGDLCISKLCVDRSCLCGAFMEHLPEEDCTNDPNFRGVWVEFDESLIFTPPQGPAPSHTFLREVRESRHPRITRYSELTDESQRLFRDLLHCLSTFDLWTHFNLIEDFFVDAGFPDTIARELALNPEMLAVQYLRT